jgi:hypothetical protein
VLNIVKIDLLGTWILCAVLFVVFMGLRVFLKLSRWGEVESEAFERTKHPQSLNSPIFSMITFKTKNNNTDLAPQPTILIFGEKIKKRLLDQYAVGLCLAGYDIKLILVSLVKNRTQSWFQQIIAELQANQIPLEPMKMILFHSIGPTLLPLIKELGIKRQPILVAPQWKNVAMKKEIGQNQDGIRLIFPLDLHQSDLDLIQDFIELNKIPQENIAPFTSGGLDLLRQETVVLARLIFWLENEKPVSKTL